MNPTHGSELGSPSPGKAPTGDVHPDQHPMSPTIIAGGGWPPGTRAIRPRLQSFTFLSVIWTAVSGVASIPLWNRGSTPWGALEVLGAILLALHAVWLALAVWAWCTEIPRARPRNRIPERMPRHRMDLCDT